MRPIKNTSWSLVQVHGKSKPSTLWSSTDYLHGTLDYGIWYKTIQDPKLIGYTNSEWAGSVDDRQNTSGAIYIDIYFTFGSRVFFLGF